MNLPDRYLLGKYPAVKDEMRENAVGSCDHAYEERICRRGRERKAFTGDADVEIYGGSADVEQSKIIRNVIIACREHRYLADFALAGLSGDRANSHERRISSRPGLFCRIGVEKRDDIERHKNRQVDHDRGAASKGYERRAETNQTDGQERPIPSQHVQVP